MIHLRRQWKIAYEIVIERLNDDERSQVDSEIASSCSVYSVLDAATKARADRDETKWRYTKRNGEVVILRDKFDRIIEGFVKYAGFIGASAQHQQPDATSLVWVAARSLIEVSGHDSSQFNRLLTHYRSILITKRA
jgi:hypothetical protein